MRMSVHVLTIGGEVIAGERTGAKWGDGRGRLFPAWLVIIIVLITEVSYIACFRCKVEATLYHSIILMVATKRELLCFPKHPWTPEPQMTPRFSPQWKMKTDPHIFSYEQKSNLTICHLCERGLLRLVNVTCTQPDELQNLPPVLCHSGTSQSQCLLLHRGMASFQELNIQNTRNKHS